MTQLYSSGISAPKKKLAPRDSKVEKKIECMYSNNEQLFIRPYGLKYRMHSKKNSTFGTLKVFWKFADFFRLL